MHLTSLSLHPHFLSPKPKPFLFPANPSHRRRPSLFSPSRSHLSPHPRRPSRTHHPMNRRRPLRTLTTSSPGSSRLTAMPSVPVRPRRRISRSTATSTSPNAVSVQNLMAKMVHNGTEAVIVEASHESLSIGKCDEVNFDIAVFTNLRRDHLDFAGTDDEYTAAKAKLFQKMTDPERNSKIINIDDPNAPFVITRGNEDVPVVTYAMENKNAVVHPPKYELYLFETQILVNTPHGILEISSVLLGRHDICNILAAATVGAPLEDIVRGIEEIDEVPGRFELIDEEQAFGVIVGHARTPDALSRLLDSVRELRPRRIITVIGCPGVGERGKKSLMTKIVTDISEVTMLTSVNPMT